MCVFLSLRTRAILPLSYRAQVAVARSRSLSWHESFDWDMTSRTRYAITDQDETVVSRGNCCCLRVGLLRLPRSRAGNTPEIARKNVAMIVFEQDGLCKADYWLLSPILMLLPSGHCACRALPARH